MPIEREPQLLECAHECRLCREQRLREPASAIAANFLASLDGASGADAGRCEFTAREAHLRAGRQLPHLGLVQVAILDE